MKKLKCAVIGVGYLGRFHAQKYAQLAQADLIAVCDTDPQTAQAVANELSVEAVYNHQDLYGRVDAVSIAATTHQHYKIAKECIEQGIHVLIEKPITETVIQANELNILAQKHGVIIQVGHLERFNAARLALDDYLDKPRFIESTRIAPYTPRGADVNVILDVMIHDIDLIQSIVNSPIMHIDAQGAPVLTNSIDIANARLHFDNGCVANVTASRISFKSERKMRIFQNDTYISIDYQNKKFAVFEKGDGEIFPGIPDVKRHQAEFDDGDALKLEIRAFVEAILEGHAPLVSGEDGAHALAIASKITQLIQGQLETLDVV